MPYNEGDYRLDNDIWPMWMQVLSNLHHNQVNDCKHFLGTLDRAYEIERTIAEQRWESRER